MSAAFTLTERSIELEFVYWLDKKHYGNGLFDWAIKANDARMIFGLSMEACVGIHESGSNNSGPMVELIQKTIGGAVKEPWCMALVQSCLAYAELKTGKRSNIFPSEHCMTVWNETHPNFRVKVSPLKYAIPIWNRTGTTQGHTGCIVEAFYPTWFKTVEGNTDGPGSRDGDEVCFKKRNWLKDGSLKVVGFLKPF